MKRYLLRLACRSPYLTPWRNCSLWGRLSWIVASGAVSGWTIKDWLECYHEGIPPLIVGDGIPYDRMPVPAGYLARADGIQDRSSSLPWPEWTELCRTGKWPHDAAPARIYEVERQHVIMDRATGATVKGGLRTERGEWPVSGIAVMALVDDLLGEDAFRTLIDVLCAEGWGNGRNYGYGHIEWTGIEHLADPPATGYVVTLGHCHPTGDLSEDGYWRWSGVPVLPHAPDTRRATLPGRFTTMLRPGATFASTKPYLGSVLQVQLPENPHYVHNGLAPVWPVKLTGKDHG